MRKHRIARISLLGLALVLVLGASGAAFAKWCDSVTLQAVVTSGNVDVRFSDQKSNDWPGTVTGMPDITVGDPAECGVWTFEDIHNPGSWTWEGTVHPEEKEVASTSCEILGDGDRMRITVENGYPCYWGDVAFSLDNIGTIPVRIDCLQLLSASGPGGSISFDSQVPLDTSSWIGIDADGQAWYDMTSVAPEQLHDFVVEHSIDFSIRLSELAICQQIEGVEDGDTKAIGLVDGDTAIPGDICVHVEQAARQNATYRFDVGICACQWNEVPCPVTTVVTEGGPGDSWTKAAAARWKGYNSGGEFYLGPMTSGSATPRVESEYNDFNGVGAKTYQLTVSYDATEDDLSASIMSPSSSLLYDFASDWGCDPSGWNAMEIVVRDSRADSGAALENVMLNAIGLGNFGTIDVPGTPGWQSWTVTGFDFSQDWTLTADLKVNGFTGNESIKVEFGVGCIV